MKVLYITSKPPYPVVDGGCFASAQFLQLLLHSGYRVDHFAIGTQKHPFSIDHYPEEIKKQTHIQGHNINTDISVVDAFIQLFKKGSYNVSRFYDKGIKSAIKAYLSANKPDLVIFDSLYSTPYLDLVSVLTDAKVIIRSHNVECDIWSDLAQSTRNSIKASYLKKLSKDLKSYEIETMSKAGVVLCISNNDLIRYEELGIKSSLHYIPVNIPAKEDFPDYQANNLLHLGSINWGPNQESLDKLISWLPDLKKEHPDLKLHLIGGGFDGSYRKLHPDTIIEEGFVTNLQERMMQGGILVTLIESGSGVRIKILEMMAIGIPVISNSKGLVGIDTDAVLVADDKETFLKRASELIRSHDKRENLGKESKKYIREHHHIDAISDKLIQILGA